MWLLIGVLVVLLIRNNFDVQGVGRDIRKISREIRRIAKELAGTIRQAVKEGKQETKDALMAYMRKNVAKYAMPYDIEFREELPKTLVGKVAYRVLEEEEQKKSA